MSPANPRLRRDIAARQENAAAPLEVMSRFAANPRTQGGKRLASLSRSISHAGWG